MRGEGGFWVLEMEGVGGDLSHGHTQGRKLYRDPCPCTFPSLGQNWQERIRRMLSAANHHINCSLPRLSIGNCQDLGNSCLLALKALRNLFLGKGFLGRR